MASLGCSKSALLHHTGYTHVRLLHPGNMLPRKLAGICTSPLRHTSPKLPVFLASLRRSIAGHSVDTATVSVEVAQQLPDKEEVKQSTAYPFTDIETKWQLYWEEKQTFRTPDEVDTSKPKYYVLDMFPYPR